LFAEWYVSASGYFCLMKFYMSAVCLKVCDI
jgi:hypothetical protein